MRTTRPDVSPTSTRTPTLLIEPYGEEEIAVRFWNIGGRHTFMMLLQRFRTEFFLARADKIGGLDWLILLLSRKDEVKSFAARNGLRVEEGS